HKIICDDVSDPDTRLPRRVEGADVAIDLGVRRVAGRSGGPVLGAGGGGRAHQGAPAGGLAVDGGQRPGGGEPVVQRGRSGPRAARAGLVSVSVGGAVRAGSVTSWPKNPQPVSTDAAMKATALAAVRREDTIRR